MKDSSNKRQETTRPLEKNTNRMILTRTPVVGVLVFIASCLALAIYSTCSTIRNGVIYLSKKKILKAILLALSVLLTASQNAERKEELVKFDDDPETYPE